MTAASTLAARLQDALLAAANDGRAAAPVSFTIDFGADFGADGAGEPAIEARVERATRSLVFAAGEAKWPDGRTAASACGVYRLPQG